MAENVEKMPQRGVSGDGWYKYPEYLPWLDGKVWKLAPGIDFKRRYADVASVLRNYAERQGKHMETRFVDGFLYVQATSRPGTNGAAR